MITTRTGSARPDKDANIGSELFKRATEGAVRMGRSTDSGAICVGADLRDEGLLTQAQIDQIRSLSHQQHRVFVLLGCGLKNKEIARRLDIHESTVKAHISAAFAKLDCNNRIKVALLSLRYTLHDARA